MQSKLMVVYSIAGRGDNRKKSYFLFYFKNALEGHRHSSYSILKIAKNLSLKNYTPFLILKSFLVIIRLWLMSITHSGTMNSEYICCQFSSYYGSIHENFYTLCYQNILSFHYFTFCPIMCICASCFGNIIQLMSCISYQLPSQSIIYN